MKGCYRGRCPSHVLACDPNTFEIHMKNSFSRRTALGSLGLGLVASTLFLSGCDKPPSSIKIGVAQPMSGNLAPLGQDLTNGVKLAADEINAKGFMINGRKVTIELVVMDDKSDPKEGEEIARKMVAAGVVAVMGDLNSGVSIAAAPIYAAAKIPQLSVSTNPKFTSMGLPTTLRIVGDDALQARAIGSFAANQLDAKKFAVIDDSTTYGKGLAEGAIAELKKANKEIVVVYSSDDQSRDFDALALQIKEKEVEVVVSTQSTFQILAIMEALKKIEYSSVTFLGGDTVKTTDMLKGSQFVKALYATSPILDIKEFASGPVFLDKYLKAFKVDPAYGSHYTYDAMYILTDAIKTAGSVQPEKVIAALRSGDGFAPVTGSMKWTPNGDLSSASVGVYVARNGKWELQQRSDRW